MGVFLLQLAKVLAIENNSTARYIDFKDGDNISRRRQLTVDRYIQYQRKTDYRKGCP
jgi:hypothetical protein